MHFSARSLSALEYDKIINMLASMASTEGAAAKARALSPTDDYDTVLLRQKRTDDAKRLINAKGYPSFSAPESTVPSAERAYKGAVLSPRELLDIASLLYSARNLQDYIKTDKLFDTSIDELFDRILVSRNLETKIKKAIISEDMIADEASSELAEIRRKIRNTENTIASGFAHLCFLKAVSI